MGEEKRMLRWGARMVEDNKEYPRKTRQRALRSLRGVTRGGRKI